MNSYMKYYTSLLSKKYYLSELLEVVSLAHKAINSILLYDKPYTKY